MKIRKANEKDLEKIAEIFKKEYAKSPYNEKWTDKTSLEAIKEYQKSNQIFVAETEKKIIGFIIFSEFSWYDGKRGYLDEIVVDSREQGKGVGKELMNFMEDYFKKRSIKKIRLLAVTRSRALEIYKKIGYGKIENYIVMEKEIK